MGTVYRAIDRTTGRVVASSRFCSSATTMSAPGGDLSQEVAPPPGSTTTTSSGSMPPVIRPSASVFRDGVHRRPQPGRADLQGKRCIPPAEAAELVAQAARGVQAAHSAGLVHSDIKPANILIDLATGLTARVGDFGVARLETESSGQSREGVLPGTPAYLSPEQARG